ncbi:MurR/RpiR family transcriptional regulator [Fusobacterium ulcerans]|uniref:DNA-binding transcriptional regulator HexR n=1 Tax=Fusobacterium ulcerans TaxID=861 RepID=A0AAX1TU67_9FUSO|nr:MurR/RpiR family transcriptional regulator [Fusobacterium ulcerans]BBA52765.1 putative transcriptional regulator [Fusobacterium varium]AVQ28065.1 MurR/RpiR family transcriptional regulator [Fusobacterium ulcerans]EFS25527.2 hypothetical protein FUAG_01042 [Fusobacterium ulcerans ATCC 49185]RGY66589.1 MurR/RpiR family transcriptional regulator [Fusobacterium ulcerans]SQI99672.1 DNA-binding transcriptional regulator HexR [Fusobacterium ulcerans]
MGNLLNRLLIMLNDNDLDSTNYHIAMTLLMNFHSLHELSIGEVAKLCSVSKSTISKFIRILNFEDYADFKASASFKENRYGYNLNYNQNIAEYIEKYGYSSYLKCIQQDIDSLNGEENLKNIEKLAQDLIRYKKVASFGLLFSEIGAIDLQMKLAYNGKFLITNLDDVKQDTFIRRADEETLIIIYSNSGFYLKKYQLSEFQEEKDYSRTKAKIVLITGNEEMKNYSGIDNCIAFHHNSEIQSHSIIYPLINDHIVNKYRQLIKNK